MKVMFYIGIALSGLVTIALSLAAMENVVSLLSGYFNIVSTRGVLFLIFVISTPILAVFLLIRSFGFLSRGRQKTAVGMAWSPIALSLLVGIFYLGTFAH